MSFMKHIKKLSFVTVNTVIVPLSDIRAQYNPDRFRHWKSLHDGPDDKVLDMSYSPHVRLLNQYSCDGNIWKKIRKTPYYQLQQKYGRRYKWIEGKVKGFLQMYDVLKESSNIDDLNIFVVLNPIRKNPYNAGYEIFEGHHRVACLFGFNVKKTLVTVLRVVR